MESKILHVGIDVSKKKLDVCLTTQDKDFLSSKVIENNVKGFDVLEKWIDKHAQKHNIDEIRLCIESTGIYSEGVSEFFWDKNYYVSMVNPAQIKAYRDSLKLRTKTDKVDARVIANYSAVINPKVSSKPSKEFRVYRTMIRHLDYLIKRRGEEKGHLETANDQLIEDSINQLVHFYDQQIKELMENIEKHLQENDKLSSDIKLLESIPGIGRHTAQILVCELHPQNPGMKLSKKAQSAHAGLAPSQRESGSSVRGRTIICKAGNPRLRKCLYFPAMTAVKYNPLVSDLYNRLLNKGKPKKVALVACMRKLLVIAVGILNHQTPFDPQWVKKRHFKKIN